jgi:hypothetical protein
MPPAGPAVDVGDITQLVMNKHSPVRSAFPIASRRDRGQAPSDPEMAQANLRSATVGPFYKHQAAQSFSPRSSWGSARIPHQASSKPWPRSRHTAGPFFRMTAMPALRRNIRPTRSVVDGTSGGLLLRWRTAPLRRGFFMQPHGLALG